MRNAWPVAFLAASALLSGCSGGGKELLRDPGFEDGGDAWFWLQDQSNWVGFEVTEGGAAGGERSARMDLKSDGRDTLIAGAVQNFTAPRLPDTLAGSYRVERWQTGVDKTYLQAVVSLFPRADATEPLCPGLEPQHPCQVAFPIAGLDRIPFSIGNRQFVFLGTAEPTVGPWQRFEVNLRDEFVGAWGADPAGFSHAWVYFEVRYERAEGDAGRDVDAVVHWDDLSLR